MQRVHGREPEIRRSGRAVYPRSSCMGIQSERRPNLSGGKLPFLTCEFLILDRSIEPHNSSRRYSNCFLKLSNCC